MTNPASLRDERHRTLALGEGADLLLSIEGGDVRPPPARLRRA